MERTAMAWRAVAVAAAMVTGATGARAAGPDAQSAPGGRAAGGATAPEARVVRGDDAMAPDYSADVIIDESIVDDKGTVVETRPQTRYRLLLRRTARGWRTEITYPEARLFPKGPLADPRSGHRIVIDGDLASGRVYDAAGRLVAGGAPTGAAAVAPATDPGLVLSDLGVKSRRTDLVRKFGPPLERLAGRDRYLANDGDLVTETLVEPATMLPVEVNVARGGALEHRTSIAYGRMPGGRWYVARTRSEVALPDGRGRRFVSERTHLNVVSQEGR